MTGVEQLVVDVEHPMPHVVIGSRIVKKVIVVFRVELDPGRHGFERNGPNLCTASVWAPEKQHSSDRPSQTRSAR